MIYQASPIKPKRKRATKAEMVERRQFVIDFAERYHPVTVRQVFYAATVHGVVEKEESGYDKIQNVCLSARRDGSLPYNWIADSSRTFYQLSTHSDLSNAAHSFANSYRIDFWHDETDSVEIWLEKEALSGVIRPVTREYRVKLVPTRGFPSETIVEEAVRLASWEGRERLFIYPLYDFDASGQHAQKAIERRMAEIASDYDVEVIHRPLALNYEQVIEMSLPTRPPKKKSRADQKWQYEIAAELDAIPPNILRDMVRDALEPHMPSQRRDYLMGMEQMDRSKIRMALSEF
jgi:hypothetical protein